MLAAPSSARVRYRTTPLFLRQRRLSVAEEGPAGEPCARDVYMDAGAVPCSSPQARIPARASAALPPAVGAPLALSPLANDYAIKPSADSLLPRLCSSSPYPRSYRMISLLIKLCPFTGIWKVRECFRRLVAFLVAAVVLCSVAEAPRWQQSFLSPPARHRGGQALEQRPRIPERGL